MAKQTELKRSQLQDAKLQFSQVMKHILTRCTGFNEAD